MIASTACQVIFGASLCEDFSGIGMQLLLYDHVQIN